MAQAVTTLAPAPVLRVYDNANALAVGGQIYTYVAGTTTPVATYTDATGVTPNTNPVILDSRGEAQIWLLPSQAYKFVAYDAENNLLWSADNLTITTPGTVQLSSIAALRSLSRGNTTTATILGYYSDGDGGGGLYYYDSTDTTSADNGGTIIVAADDSRWKLQAQSTMISVKQFGAKGDGTTNDTTSIQNCITALIGSKQTMIFPSGIYPISSSLTIGNGTSTTFSSLNGLEIVCAGAGVSAAELGSAGGNVVLKWTGAAAGTMMNINGPIYGINIKGLTLDCNALAATGINAKHLVSCTWSNMLVMQNTNGAGYIWGCYDTPITGIAVGSSDNVFTNVSAKYCGSGGSGAAIGETTSAGILDVARCTWINCEFWRDNTNAATFSLRLSYVDNCTFVECDTAPMTGLGIGLYILPPTGNLGFPGAITMINCPIGGNVSAAGTWAANEGILFLPYPVGDGQVVPSTPTPKQLYGLTSKGDYFGGLSVGENNPPIMAVLSTTAALTFGTIAANTSSDQGIAIVGCEVGDVVTVSCLDQPSYLTGLTLSAYVSVAGTVLVRWANCTASTKEPTAGATYRIVVTKF